jgi:hypothetical protein
VGGYVFAIVIAIVVVRIYVAMTSSPDRQSASGMYAFGDSMLALAVFGVAAIPATAAALYFLRSRRWFWIMLTVTAVLVACTALVATALSLGPANLRLQPVGMLAPIRVLIAPLLGLFFLLSALLAPTRAIRIWLASASAVEVIVFVSVVFTWWRSSR